MTRITAREIAVRLVYEIGFDRENIDDLTDFRLSEESFELLGEEDATYSKRPDDIQEAFIRKIVRGVFGHLPEIDGYIEKYSIGWPLKRMSRISAAILRVCMFELLYMPEVPVKSSINEAVRIAKKLDSAEAPAFINGILGSFVRGERSGK